MNLFDLTGKVALVTGSSRGIGEAIVRRMADHGAKVMVSSRKAEACQKVADDINARRGEHAAEAVSANINHKEQLQSLVARTREIWGKIDILVCNAALNPHYGSQLEIPDDVFDKILGANIRSSHWLCQLTLPEMIERRDGNIILISSVGGLRGEAGLGTYCISKAADLQLARNLAVEFGRKNIRANCIVPGLIKTDFARALWDNPEFAEAMTSRTPLRRIGTPDEVAGAAVFLASKAGSFVTGQAIVCDGGFTIS